MAAKTFKRDPMKTKTGKTRLGPLNIAQLDNLLEMCRPKHRSKILRRIKFLEKGKLNAG